MDIIEPLAQQYLAVHLYDRGREEIWDDVLGKKGLVWNEINAQLSELSDAELGVIVGGGKNPKEIRALRSGGPQARIYSTANLTYRQILCEMATDVLLDRIGEILEKGERTLIGRR